MFSIQKIKEAEFFNELTIHGHFVSFAFFKCSQHKKLKWQNFYSNRQFIVASLYLLCCKYYREVVLLLKFSIQKIKEAKFLLELTIHGRFVVFAFFKYYREALFFKCSRYKKLKRQNFSTNWQFTVASLYLLFFKYYREALLYLNFSIQKLKNSIK